MSTSMTMEAATARESAEIAIGTLASVPPGEGREFRTGNLVVTVFHTRSGEVFATQPECPHRRGPLRDGLIDDATVMCPLHDRIYEFRTGRGIGNDCALTIYPVRATDDGTLLLTPHPITSGTTSPAALADPIPA